MLLGATQLGGSARALLQPFEEASRLLARLGLELRPSAYRLTYDVDANEYRIALTQLERR